MNFGKLTGSKAIKGVILNTKLKKRITLHFTTEEGETVPFEEVIGNVQKYVEDQLKTGEAESQINTQVYPLASGIMLETMADAIGSTLMANVMTVLPQMKQAILYEIVLTFYLMRFIKQNNLKIATTEEDIEEEELNKLLRHSNASQFFMLAAMAGLDEEGTIKTLVEYDLVDEQTLVEGGYEKARVSKYERGIATTDDPFVASAKKLTTNKDN